MATKATSSSASKGDWILSFGFGDDVDSDSDSDNGIPAANFSSSILSSTDITQVGGQSLPSEETQLSHELDISKREDTAIFQKNPWSIAKMNAACRSKPAPRNPIVSAQRNADSITPVKKDIYSRGFQEAMSFNAKVPDAQRKPLVRRPRQMQNASGSAKTTDSTRFIRTNEPRTASKLESQDRTVKQTNDSNTNYQVHDSPLLSNSQGLSIHRTPSPLVQKYSPVSYPTQLLPTTEKFPSPPTQAISSPKHSPRNEQLIEYTHNHSSSPYSSPLKKRRLGDQITDTMRFADPAENPRPTLTKNHKAAAVYSKSMFGINSDKDWTTFERRKSAANKKTDTNLLTTGFSVPGNLLRSAQRFQTTPVKTDGKRTLLTLFQLPPAHTYQRSK